MRFSVWAGLAILLLVAFFATQGLEDADRFASVLGLLLMVAVQAHAHAAAPPPDEAHRGRHRRRLSKPAAVVIVVGLGSFSCNVVGPSGSDPYRCGVPAGAPGTITPRPARAGQLEFCPVRVDDGAGPITGPFVLAGQVAGTYPEGRELMLFVRIDPATCDTAGRPAVRGRYLVHQVELHPGDSGWSYVDTLGEFPPGVTFGRIYEYATASPASARAIRNRSVPRSIDPEEFPADVRFLARFDVPPGVAPERAPCGRFTAPTGSAGPPARSRRPS